MADSSSNLSEKNDLKAVDDGTTDLPVLRAKSIEAAGAGGSVSSLEGGTTTDPTDIDPQALRSGYFKMDLMMVPQVVLLYFLAFLDRGNIGNAKVAGLTVDLGLSALQFSAALTVFYVSYLLIEIPTNLWMKRVGPQVMIPIMAIGWGTVTALQGTVTSYETLLTARFFLGVFEGGLAPGLALYLSSFYKRHQLQLRLSLLFSSTSLAGAFSGLLAAAIITLEGQMQKRGWQWIFIIEGVISVFFGVIFFFTLPARPSKLPFIKPAEHEAIQKSLKADWSAPDDQVDQFSWSEVFAVLKSVHFWIMAPALFFNGVTLHGLSLFGPVIVNALGFDATRSQLMSVPPYAAAFVASLITAYYSDKYSARGFNMMFGSLTAATGYAIFLATDTQSANYAALFLQAIGAYCTVPAIISWNANNFYPHYRRATALAGNFFFSGAGGVLSTWLFTTPPRYTTATIINLTFSLGLFVASLSNYLWLKRKNALKAEARKDPNYTDDAASRRKLGDAHPGFVYSL